MPDNVVKLTGKSRSTPDHPAPQVWYAQVDQRLSRIEGMMTRLEWQIWLIVCGIVALFVLTLMNTNTAV